MKKILSIFITAMCVLSFTGTAAAHVVVKPGDVTTGSFQTFVMGVPNEREAATVEVKLLIPEGLVYVSPNLKPDWTINIEKTGEGEEAVVKSITWTGGSIGAGFRDDFSFSAKVPDTKTELQWRAYQTYEGGVVVSWDKSKENQPKKADGSPDFSTAGPFSVTKVAAQQASPTQTSSNNVKNDDDSNVALYLSIGALILGFANFAMLRKKNG